MADLLFECSSQGGVEVTACLLSEFLDLCSSVLHFFDRNISTLVRVNQFEDLFGLCVAGDGDTRSGSEHLEFFDGKGSDVNSIATGGTSFGSMVYGSNTFFESLN
jgi:hypothetical protein